MAVYKIKYYAYFIIKLLFVPFIICTSDTNTLEGDLTPIEAHPYMASVQHWTFPEKMIMLQCAGVIIASRSVLTVASCYSFFRHRERYDHLDWFVRVGSSIANFQGETYGVDSFITYDEGKDEEDTSLHDIALVVTDIPFKYSSTVQPISIPLTSAPVSHKVTLTGWTYWKLMTNEHRLRSLELTTLPKENCSNTRPDVLCADVLSDKIYHYVCYGDAGAPVVNALKDGASLIGMLLWGGCDMTLYHASILDVPYYSSWISRVVVNE